MPSYLLHGSHLLHLTDCVASLLGFRNQKENRRHNKNYFFVCFAFFTHVTRPQLNQLKI